ncbi:MAG: MucR family transcriptional regulator [Alphaproteobacteria bacterium]|nr:MucR family transcriptional regulator [Alphaproteobacteria bacterium]
MTEDTNSSIDKEDVLRMTAEVVSAYVGNNVVASSDIPDLIRSVHGALSGLGSGADRQETQKPAVAVRRSVTPDFIICLEDGKKLKMLKRHLRTTYNMTPEEYRAKWGLPPDYPMVAPNYAAQRSQFAKRIGLGRKRQS